MSVETLAGMIPGDVRKLFNTEFANADIAGVWVVPGDIAEAPASPGAYLVCIRICAAVDVNIPRLSDRCVPAGWHVYVGSALGSGGIRARLKRHFKRTKSSHWHIDQLTAQASQMAALALVNGNECKLVSKLLGSGSFKVNFPGFGSSDCRQCKSHLLTATHLPHLL